MEVVRGSVTSVKQGALVITVPYTNLDRYSRREYCDVLVGLEDGRTITPQQRRMAYKLINSIADYVGQEADDIKQTTKHDFVRDHLEGLRKELFSLSNCDVTTAREYISYLADLIIRFQIPLDYPLIESVDDIEHYMHTCAVRKVCAVCGRPADLHHVDRVGMGNDRTQINHIGMRCMTLCRAHHTELHAMGDTGFCGKYHVIPIEIDEDIAKANKLRRTTK